MNRFFSMNKKMYIPIGHKTVAIHLSCGIPPFITAAQCPDTHLSSVVSTELVREGIARWLPKSANKPFYSQNY